MWGRPCRMTLAEGELRNCEDGKGNDAHGRGKGRDYGGLQCCLGPRLKVGEKESRKGGLTQLQRVQGSGRSEGRKARSGPLVFSNLKPQKQTEEGRREATTPKPPKTRKSLREKLGSTWVSSIERVGKEGSEEKGSGKEVEPNSPSRKAQLSVSLQSTSARKKKPR